MPEIIRQLRFAFRKLAHEPLFTGTAIVTLALGIGANAVIFSVVNGVLLKPLPYAHAESLVGLWHTAPGLKIPLLEQSDATYLTYRSDNRSFEDVGLLRSESYTVTGTFQPERVTGALITEPVLRLLGARPLRGRLFNTADDAPHAPPTVMLSYGYWQRRFGGQRGILGTVLLVDGQPHEIVGVLPAGLRLLELDPGLYVPYRIDPALAKVDGFGPRAIGRLRAAGLDPVKALRAD